MDLTDVLCTEIAYVVPTSQPVSASLTDIAAGGEGLRAANSDSTVHGARGPKLEYHTMMSTIGGWTHSADDSNTLTPKNMYCFKAASA